MFLKGTLLLLGTVVISAYRLNDAATELLTNLQAEHYKYITTSLDVATALTSKLYFADDDLKANAQNYFIDLAQSELEQLAPLKEECGEKESCLMCFDTEGQLSEIAVNITATLVDFMDTQKTQFNDTITDIKNNLRDSALLTLVVYEQYRHSSNFETDATNYYDRIRKALVNEADLLDRTVTATMKKLIQYSVDATVQATDQLEGIFYAIVECAEEQIHP